MDPLAVGRAALLDLQCRRVGYGASTLTMQLVRRSHWPAAPHSLTRKLARSTVTAGAALRRERFGSALNVHPHLHTIAADGLFVGDPAPGGLDCRSRPSDTRTHEAKRG